MQILEVNKSDPAAALEMTLEMESSRSWIDRPWEWDQMAFGEFLQVEVRPEQKGLRVMRIGRESPFRQLRPLGSFTMKGSVESGDRIVAIDGILTSNASDLARMISDRRRCEVAIYDHRTRLTVSWQLHFQEILESSHCRTRLLAS